MTHLAIGVGDSITVLSESAITSAASAIGWTTSFYATDGDTITQMTPSVATAIARNPQALIINLGTNDALQHR